MAQTHRALIPGWLGVVLLVAGCASGAGRPAEETRRAGSVPAAPAEPAPEPVPSPAGSLIAESERLDRGGDPERAAAALERAVRIDPYSARAWLGLARLRLSAGETDEAHALARRALSVAEDEPESARAARNLLSDLDQGRPR